MELSPKPFQLEALRYLREFLEQARLGKPLPELFAATAQEVKPPRRREVYRPLAGMPEVPTVCLRLPTGGGKTVLAAMAVAVMAESYLEREFPMVLWLAPTDLIRTQTLKALKDPDHAYRRALGAPFGGRVRVFDMVEFATVRSQDLQQNVCVVVGTMQTLRVTNTEGRRVYAHNENLEGHFGPAALATPGLEPIEDGCAGAGTPKFSFANLLKVQRPVVILDEAHQFVTRLAEEVRRRIGPSVVLELTATPHEDLANVLYRATAVELREADMIKLPVVLTERLGLWQDALCEATKTRKRLAMLAASEPEYIRPILLVQAQNAGQEADWKVVKQHLMEAEGLAAQEIAVHTCEVRELDGVDLLRADCPITTVVTVRALMEGWDCPFAYVLCSVANVGAAQDVEQLLGRVLRMPYALRRKAPELNKAYAHLTSERFGAAALALRDGLVKLGFEREEVDAALEQPGELPLEPAGGAGRPVFRAVLPARPALEPLPAEEREGFQLEAMEAGQFAVTVQGPIAPAAAEALLAASPERREALRAEIAEHNAAWASTASERGVPLAVPRLAIRIDGELELFDEGTVPENHNWDLSKHPADLSGFDVDETQRKYTLDLEGERFTLTPLMDPSLQLELLTTGVTVVGLASWLDRRLRDLSMNQTMLAPWLLAAVEAALGRPRMTLEALDRGRFLLLRKLGELLGTARAEEARKGYEQLLFGGSSMNVVTDEEFSFRYPREYGAEKVYRGPYRFTKHYYPQVGEFDSDEEFECAVELDRLTEVRHWVRNLAKRERSSFWLQTAKDKFYPDFVAEVEGGRKLVVEYKGEGYRTNDDSKEKDALGQLWAQRGDRCVFVMVDQRRHGRSLEEQLKAALREPGRGLG